MNKRQAGLTMLEVLIAGVILAVVTALASMIIWSSANHVQSSEIAFQMENQAREVLMALTRELHQTRMAKVLKVDTTQPIPTTPTALAVSNPTPGTTTAYPVWDPTSPTLNTFDGIRFALPGTLMDLTAVTTSGTVNGKSTPLKNNASADKNGTVDSNGNKIDNFDLTKFKANANTSDWLYEIQYWWEIDRVNPYPLNKLEGVQGSGPNGFVRTGKDQNGNLVVDEGQIKKMETWYHSDGSVARRTVSTICRDVTDLTFTVPGWPAWVAADTKRYYAATTPPKFPPGSEKYLTVSITMRKPDPRYPKDPLKVISKTVSASIDLRN